MTPRLFGVLLAGITMLLAALATGAQLFYLLGGFLLFGILFSLLSVLLPLFTLRVYFPPEKKRAVNRGDSIPIKLTLRHYGIFPVGQLRLMLSMPDSSRATDKMELPWMPIKSHTVTVSFPCPHRGVYKLGIEGLEIHDLFHLFRFFRKLKDMTTAVQVLPAYRDITPPVIRFGESMLETRTRATEDNANPADSRKWQEGDALKKIHWKLSMRKREIMVRTYEESVRPDTLILLDLSPLQMPSGHAATYEDAACEIALSVAKEQLENGYPVRMPLTSKKPLEISGQGSQDIGRFLSALTTVSFDCPFPYERVLTFEMRRMQRTGVVVLITTRADAKVADIATRFRRYGNDMQVDVYQIAETGSDQLLAQLESLGISAYRIDPFDTGDPNDQ